VGNDAQEFEKAAHGKRRSLVGELAGFLGATRKYWLLPLVIVLLLLVGLVILGGTAAAPFIYTLF
jgi:hypothetical protein